MDPAYDAFLSYNRRDSAAVELLAERLVREAGLRVWIDRNALSPGESWRREIEQALNDAAAAAIVWGPHGLGPVQLQERDLAYVIRDANPDFRLIHVFLPGAEPPRASWASVDTWIRFAGGLDEQETFDRLVAALKGLATRQEFTADLPDDPAPYRGLAAFTTADAHLFFGRGDVIEQLLRQLRHAPFVAVIGPSGCGKTSLVQAGVLPRLDSNGRGPDDGRIQMLLRPGSRPLEALAAALLRVQSTDDPVGRLAQITETLAADPGAFAGLLNALFDPARPLVLVVDRLEELFGLCADPQQRAAFASAILSATSRGRVVVTMRADFYGELGALRDLADRVVAHQLYIKPLPAEAVIEVIEAPAAQVGAVFEKGLAAQLAMDALGDGEVALPLLQHTLELLWRRRRGRWLTWDAYREIGGVSGALRYHADGVIDALSDADAGIARRLLTGLVWVGEQRGAVAARPIAKVELLNRFADPARAEGVLQRLADERLVVIRADAGGAMADIAHDTLPLYWSRLRTWVDADRAFLQWRERLRLVMSEWQRLDQDPASLLHGSALLEAERWQTEQAVELGAGERRFIERSLAKRDSDRRARERRRRRALLAVSGALVVTALLAGLLAWQWRLAEAQTRAALAGQWAAEAQRLAGSEPDRTEQVALLAVESFNAVPSRQAYQALHAAVALMPRRVVGGLGHPASINRLRFDPAGRLLLSASDDHTVGVWDWRASRAVQRLQHAGRVNLAIFSPDGKLIASASEDDTAAVWDTASGRRLFVLPHDGDVVDLAFSPDGYYLATASHDKKARLWNLDDGTLERTFEMVRWVTAVTFSDDGRYLAIGSGSAIELWADRLRLGQGAGAAQRDRLARERPGGVLVWDIAQGSERLRLKDGQGINDVSFSPDSRLIAVASADRSATTHDLLSGEALASVQHEDGVQQVAFSPDGRYVASISASGLLLTSAVNSAKAWDPHSGQEYARVAFAAPLLDLAVSPSGRTFVVGSGDRTARVVEPMLQREIARIGWPGSVLAVAFSPDAHHVAVAGAQGDLSVWEVADSAARFGLASNWSNRAVTLSPDGSYLAGYGPAGSIELWPIGGDQARARVATGDEVAVLRVAIDGGRLATTHADGIARLWDASSGTPIAQAPRGDVNGLAIPAPDGRHWAFTGETLEQLNIVDPSAPSQAVTVRHEAGIVHAVFSADSRLLATAGQDAAVRVWEVATGRLRQALALGGDVSSLAFSHDAQLLAVAGVDDVRVYRTLDGQLAERIPHAASLVAFSHDDGYLAIADQHDLVIWDRIRGEVLGSIAHDASVYQVAFSGDGETVVTATGELFSAQHRVQRWLWQPEALLAEACTRATRNLTQAEWIRYMSGLSYRRTCPDLPIDLADAMQHAAALAKAGDRDAAHDAYRRAARWAIDAGDAAACNGVCWLGGLDGFAETVLPACDCAVDLSTEQRAFHRDSRALARARSGDRLGAAEDLTAFVAALRDEPAMAGMVAQREAWLQILSNGGDPYDHATLEALRRE